MSTPSCILPAPSCVFFDQMPRENPATDVRRIVIAVHDTIWPHALRRICHNVFPRAECEEHRTAAAALESLADKPADLTITGLVFPDVDGLTVLDRIRPRSRRLLIVSGRKDDWTIMTLRSARFDGFFDPEADDLAVLEQSLPWLAKGASYYSLSVQPRLLAAIMASVLAETLTTRELEVLRVIGDGSSNVEAARKLKITQRTVEMHRENIREKLGVSSSARLVWEAVRLGVVRPDRSVGPADGS